MQGKITQTSDWYGEIRRAGCVEGKRRRPEEPRRMNRFLTLGRRSRLLVALVAGGAAFGVVSIVQASIPGPNGAINACYRKGDDNGQLRVIDSGAACKRKESPLTWNQATPEYAYIYDLSPPDVVRPSPPAPRCRSRTTAP